MNDLIDVVRDALHHNAQDAPQPTGVPHGLRRRVRRARVRTTLLAGGGLSAVTALAVLAASLAGGPVTKPLPGPFAPGSGAYGSPTVVLAGPDAAYVVTDDGTTILRVTRDGEIAWRHHFEPLGPGATRQGIVHSLLWARDSIVALVHVQAGPARSTPPYSAPAPRYAEGLVRFDAKTGRLLGTLGSGGPPTDAAFDGEWIWVVAGHRLSKVTFWAGAFGQDVATLRSERAEVEIGGGGVRVLDGDRLLTFDATQQDGQSDAISVPEGLSRLRMLATLFALDGRGELMRYHASERRFIRAATDSSFSDVVAFDGHLYGTVRSADGSSFRVERYRLWSPHEIVEPLTGWLPGNPMSIAAGAGLIWIATESPADLIRLPIPRTRENPTSSDRQPAVSTPIPSASP